MARSRRSAPPPRRPAPPPARQAAPPPQYAQPAPPPAPSGGGGSFMGSLGSSIAQGMALGTGSAIAHRAVDSFMGPRTVQHEYVNGPPAEGAAPAAAADACGNQSKAFQDCVSANGSDIARCQFYVDMLNQCRNSSSQVSLQ
eukprot:TRINITY_DN9338_c0_g1_i1.p1 TRINITY_DN9338_c0_g1~~TRINITY_DN9338_c0_g1_i1.p1  ORF type:complete len:142 (-),score=36.39 TRINITY_DN9338_c0_g1_i1:714-1139(-)